MSSYYYFHFSLPQNSDVTAKLAAITAPTVTIEADDAVHVDAELEAADPGKVNATHSDH